MSTKIRNSEVFVFEGCSHAPIYEKVEEFNQRSLQFLQPRWLSHCTTRRTAFHVIDPSRREAVA